jgi:hypothetical protein
MKTSLSVDAVFGILARNSRSFPGYNGVQFVLVCAEMALQYYIIVNSSERNDYASIAIDIRSGLPYNPHTQPFGTSNSY